MAWHLRLTPEQFDSSDGFHLPDHSVLSPEQRRSFPLLCPDLVVELALRWWRCGRGNWGCYTDLVARSHCS